MGKPSGFKEYQRETLPRRSASLRILDWQDVYQPDAFSVEDVARQGARCMDCGVPFCHRGCPLGNIIPEWNDLVYKNRWREALDMLHRTNNFPEFTGRVCPAPCEEACVLSINDNPVTIKLIEQSIVDYGFKKGWVKPEPPLRRSGRRIAVVGSGPAGLACAEQLNKAGHSVVVFERDDRIGGLLTYGIPDFKLAKELVERRVQLMRDSGVEFKTNVEVGVGLDVQQLREEFDALCLAGGSTEARDLNLPGRELKGIHLAMEYLTLQNKANQGDNPSDTITAKDKNVVILGGGDTGADCLGTALRQGAKSVKQYELLPEPPKERTSEMPWPTWPMILRTRSGSAHEEGGERDWSIMTKGFRGEKGRVQYLQAVRLKWGKDASGRYTMEEIPGSEFEVECDLCFLALGFLHPERQGVISALGVELDGRGNVKTGADYMSSLPGVFAAGDMQRGQSLVVWAIAEGRKAAAAIDRFLVGRVGERV